MRKDPRRWILFFLILILAPLCLSGCFYLYSGKSSYAPGRHPATTPNTYESWCLQWKQTLNCHFTSKQECEDMAAKGMYKYDATRCFRGYR